MKNHLKSLAAPRTWKISRKATKFVARPLPGAHTLEMSMPLQLVMKELMKVARTRKEVKFILQHNTVLVDGTKRHEEKIPVGFLDIVSLPETKQHWRITLTQKGKLSAVPVEEKEAGKKIARIESKQMIKGGKIQIGLSDGRSIIVDKGDYKTRDALVLEVPGQKIAKVIPLEKGAEVILIGGKQMGHIVKVKEVKGDVIIYESEKGEAETLTQYAYPISKDITVQ